MKFDEYYGYYLTLHQNNICRRLHICGQLFTLIYIGFIVVNGFWWWLIASPFIVYPFAWSGHFFFEKNKPAAFSNPLWAKLSDFRMMKDVLVGKIKW
jgi:hypothetical protein|tara:strand:+ start:15058 stop:15348 length:291 start_codon:yes stop_codon:yes gene_type:complete